MALVFELALGSTAALVSGIIGSFIFFTVGFVYGIDKWKSSSAPARGISFQPRNLGNGLAKGLFFCLLSLICWGGSNELFWLRLALITGLVASPLSAFYSSLRGIPADDIAEGANPRSILIRDRRTVMILGVVGGPLVAIGTAAYCGYAFGAGLTFGIVTGAASWLALWFSIPVWREAQWGSYLISKEWLAFRRLLPWRLMSFLDDAHFRGVLRQVGGRYQFRHIGLQHRLAARHKSAAPSWLRATVSTNPAMSADHEATQENEAL